MELDFGRTIAKLQKKMNDEIENKIKEMLSIVDGYREDMTVEEVEFLLKDKGLSTVINESNYRDFNYRYYKLIKQDEVIAHFVVRTDTSVRYNDVDGYSMKSWISDVVFDK